MLNCLHHLKILPTIVFSTQNSRLAKTREQCGTYAFDCMPVTVHVHSALPSSAYLTHSVLYAEMVNEHELFSSLRASSAHVYFPLHLMPVWSGRWLPFPPSLPTFCTWPSADCQTAAGHVASKGRTFSEDRAEHMSDSLMITSSITVVYQKLWRELS